VVHLFNKPVASSFASSFLMASLLTGVKRRSHCFFGVALGSTFRQCSINSLGTPSIYAGFHANISRLALRKLMSALSYFSLKLPSIKAVSDRSPSCNGTTFDRRLNPDLPRGTVNLIGGDLDVDDPRLRTNRTPQSLDHCSIGYHPYHTNDLATKAYPWKRNQEHK
jgi:hypothetical protein